MKQNNCFWQVTVKPMVSITSLYAGSTRLVVLGYSEVLQQCNVSLDISVNWNATFAAFVQSIYYILLNSNLKPYSSWHIKSCQLVRNVRQTILLRCIDLYLRTTSFKFVPLSFRMLSYSQDVRGLPLGLFPFIWDVVLSLPCFSYLVSSHDQTISVWSQWLVWS